MIRTVIKLLVFVAVCTVITLYLAFTIGNIQLFQHRYKLTATFEDVSGLLANDNVKVAGVPVGKVTGIKIVDGRARVTFNVRDNVNVPTDSKVGIRWRNLLGQRYVYIYPGTASTMLEDKASIPLDRTISVVDLGELFNRLGPIVKAIEPAKVNAFLDTVVAALDGNEAKVRQAISDLAVLTKGIASRDLAIQRLIENSNAVAAAINSRDAEIRTVLDNLVTIAGTFSDNTEVLDQAVTELGDFSQNLGSLLSANRGEVDRAITNLHTLVELVRTKLPTVDRVLGNLDETARAFFNSSRYGEWLNQVIPCGRVGYDPAVDVPLNICILHSPTTSGSAAAGAATAGAPVPQIRQGSAAIRHLLELTTPGT